MPGLIVSLNKRIIKDGRRIAELEKEVQHQVERREEEKLRAVSAEVERDALRDAIVDYANGDSKVHPIDRLNKLVKVVERGGGQR